jgi:hypothetical protein
LGRGASVGGGEPQPIDRPGDFEDALRRAWPWDYCQLTVIVPGLGVGGEERMQPGGVQELDAARIDHVPFRPSVKRPPDLTFEVTDGGEIKLASGGAPYGVALSLDRDRERHLWIRRSVGGR